MFPNDFFGLIKFEPKCTKRGNQEAATERALMTSSTLDDPFSYDERRWFANRRRGPRRRCCFGTRGLRRRFANQRRSS